MITTVLAMNIFVCSEKTIVYSGDLETIKFKDCCHALEMFFRLNKDLETDLNVKNLPMVF